MTLVERVREAINASRGLQRLATGVIATVVTALVVIPLTFSALDSRDDDSRPFTAPTDGIVATLGPSSGDLHGQIIAGEPLITFEFPDVGAVAYRLVTDDGNEIRSGVDEFGPDFSLVNSPAGLPMALDSRTLADGAYTIFATLTLVDDNGDFSEIFRMAEFEVDNGG